MSDTTISSAAFADTKPHYELLDGLRGVAALLVVLYHHFEVFRLLPEEHLSQRSITATWPSNFFFILSGFVIGYAYDDRLGKTMTTSNFFKRRLNPSPSDDYHGSDIGSDRFLSYKAVFNGMANMWQSRQ